MSFLDLEFNRNSKGDKQCIMNLSSKNLRKLVTVALITSPILAIYNVAPITLLINSGHFNPQQHLPPKIIDNPLGILLPITIITINAMLIWAYNIWLVRKAHVNNMNPWKKYLLSFAFVPVLVGSLMFLTWQIRGMPIGIGSLRFYPLIGSAANNAIILIIIDLVLSRERRMALEVEKANLESVNLKARHEQLKQQIQPHFLFNALNTLKLLIKRNPDTAESYSVRLSNFLRASILEGMDEKHSIADDLRLLEDFMELQKERFPQAIEYNYSISANTSKLKPSDS